MRDSKRHLPSPAKSKILISPHARKGLQDRKLDFTDLLAVLESPDRVSPIPGDPILTGDLVQVAYRTQGNEILMVKVKKINKDSFAIISVYDTEDPREVFKINIERARNMLAYDPGTAVILGVSAFEAFCSDKFASLGEFEKYLVDSRRISFQQLETVKEIFRIRFGVDLTQDDSSWKVLHDIFNSRHSLIHRGGVRKDGSLVRVDEEGSRKGLNAIEAIVQSIP